MLKQIFFNKNILYIIYINCTILISLINYFLKELYIKLYTYLYLIYYYIIIYKLIINFIKYKYIWNHPNYYIFIYKIIRIRIETLLYFISNYFSNTTYYLFGIAQIYLIVSLSLKARLFENLKKTISFKLIKKGLSIWKTWKINFNNLPIPFYIKTNLISNYPRPRYKYYILAPGLFLIYLIILGIFEFSSLFLVSALYLLGAVVGEQALNVTSYLYWVAAGLDKFAISWIFYFTELFKIILADRSILAKILSFTAEWGSAAGLVYGEWDLFWRYYLNWLFLNLDYLLWLKQSEGGTLFYLSDILFFGSPVDQYVNWLAILNFFPYDGFLLWSYCFTGCWADFTVLQTLGRISLLFFQHLNLNTPGAVNFWLNWGFSLLTIVPFRFFSVTYVVSNEAWVVTLLDGARLFGDIVHSWFYCLCNFYWSFIRLGFYKFLYIIEVYQLNRFLLKDFFFFFACSLHVSEIWYLLKEFLMVVYHIPYSLVWYFYGLISVLPNFGVWGSFTGLGKFFFTGLCNLVGAAWSWIFFCSRVLFLVCALLQVFDCCIGVFLDLFNAFLVPLLWGWGVSWINWLVVILLSTLGSIFGSNFLVLPVVFLWYFFSGLVVWGSVAIAVRHFFLVRTQYLVITHVSDEKGVYFGFSNSLGISRDGLSFFSMHLAEILPGSLSKSSVVTRSLKRGFGGQTLFEVLRVVRISFFLVMRFGSNGLSELAYCSPVTYLRDLTVPRVSCRSTPTVVYTLNKVWSQLPAMIFVIFRELILIYLNFFLLVKSSFDVFDVKADADRSLANSRHSFGNNGKSANFCNLLAFQAFSLFASVPLFLVSISIDLFFWVSGFTAARFQFFSHQVVGLLGPSLSTNVTTFNSRLLREFGDSPLKFSSDSFSVTSSIVRYFLFVDSGRPSFCNSNFLTQNQLIFAGGNSELIRDAGAQYFKHTVFNALFGEQHYSYPLESLKPSDAGYFSYVSLFIDNIFSGILNKGDLLVMKLIFFPVATISWILGYPFFGIFAKRLPSLISDSGNTASGVWLVGRELMLLRFLVSNIFLNPTALGKPEAKLQTRADWMSNQLLSWNSHYRWFNRWHSYAQRRSARRLRGGSVREMAYVINPYRIFEQLPDIIFPGALFTDDTTFLKNFKRLGLVLDDRVDATVAEARVVYPTTAFSKKNRFQVASSKREMPYDSSTNKMLRYRSSEIGYYRSLSSGFALSGEFSNGILLRRYNAFFSDLLGQDKVSRLLGGVGVWSVGFIPHDYFFKWFYYRYWTSKQSYYAKFLFYEKFQFLKRRKKRLGFGKLKHLQVWRRSVRSRHSKKLWRYNNYKRERLTRKLALFFYTVRGDFLNLFFGGSPYFNSSSFNFVYNFLLFNFNGFFYGSTLSWVYSLILSFPVFANFFIFLDGLLRSMLYQVLQTLSFFSHTTLLPYIILPVELIFRFISASSVGSGLNWSDSSSIQKLSSTVSFFVVFSVSIIPDTDQKLIGPTSKYFAECTLPQVEG